MHLKDEFSSPLIEDDWHFVFLDLISKWLDRWSSTIYRDGKLSPQTFVSFRHSCITLPLIVSYLIKNCGFSYVLSSRLQNDPIEHQFGLYRMMSGAQYHISYTQILESQRRLNLSNILKLFSHQNKSELSLKVLFRLLQLHRKKVLKYLVTRILVSYLISTPSNLTFLFSNQLSLSAVTLFIPI